MKIKSKNKRKKTSLRRKIVSAFSTFFHTISLLILSVGFISLFMVEYKFSIPIISEILLPFFQNYTVEVPVWDSATTSEVVSAQHWVFFLCLSLSLLISILTINISKAFIKIHHKKPIRKKMASTKNNDNINTEKNIEHEDEQPVITPKNPPHSNTYEDESINDVATSKTSTPSSSNDTNQKEHIQDKDPQIPSKSNHTQKLTNPPSSDIEDNATPPPPIKQSIDDLVDEKFGENDNGLKSISNLTKSIKINK